MTTKTTVKPTEAKTTMTEVTSTLAKNQIKVKQDRLENPLLSGVVKTRPSPIENTSTS